MQDNTQSPTPTKSSTPKPTLRQPTKTEQDGQVGLPSFRELPAALQKQIPDHAVSVHVYSKHPAQRFVIMQSTRMQEGDSTEEGLILEQIRPNGMVLKFEQQRFFKER
jgi:general secretion pathway protein B